MRAVLPWQEEELTLVEVELQVVRRRTGADVCQTILDASCNQAVRGGEREE